MTAEKEGNPEPLTPALQAELDALAAMPESEIDTAEMPPITDWSKTAPRSPFRDVAAPRHSRGLP